jgi:hypothetical protein
MLGNYQVPSQLVASRVVLSSTELISYFRILHPLSSLVAAAAPTASCYLYAVTCRVSSVCSYARSQEMSCCPSELMGMLKEALHCEAVWESGGIHPCIPNISTK